MRLLAQSELWRGLSVRSAETHLGRSGRDESRPSSTSACTTSVLPLGIQLPHVVEQLRHEAVFTVTVESANPPLAVHQHESRAVRQASVHAIQLERLHPEVVERGQRTPLAPSAYRAPGLR